MPTVRTCPGCQNAMQPEADEGSWLCACGVRVVEEEGGGLSVNYPPGYVAERPTPIFDMPPPRPPVEVGDHFERPSTPVFEVKSIAGEGVNAIARLVAVSSPANSVVQVPVDSLRYGDNGWTRVE